MIEMINRKIAEELSVPVTHVDAAVGLLDEGATVPFIARYRKERTGGLDDTQLRFLEERLRYLRELEERREVILNSIEEQGKSTPDLVAKIKEADTKTRLEDLYLPYKPKRRTKGMMAIEAGIEPLATLLLTNPEKDPVREAARFVNEEKGYGDVEAVLEGARYILMERFAEEADLIGKLRDFLWRKGLMESRVVKGKDEEGAKFADYFEYSEPIAKIPSHRALAMFRGQKEGILRLEIGLDVEDDQHPCEKLTAAWFHIADKGRPADDFLMTAVQKAWKIKIYLHLKLELFGRLKEAAEEGAITVFATNLKDLLMAAPAGPKATMGLDPGLRTGVKVVVVDDTGKLVDFTVIYPHQPRNQWDASLQTLAALCRKHRVGLVAVGNGTGSRETDRLMSDLKKANPDLVLQSVIVNEAGASVYSASELAANEFPDLDVSFRGAVSIARRLQDPLPELVKIEPKSIGVGQYQHDVNQTRLGEVLDNVVEDCVNAVGVDVNTASAPLLTRVAGLTKTIAENVVRFRDENGRFANRKILLKVPRLGPKSFEQAAGFLRVPAGEDPLDASAVHPEAYPVVARISQKTGVSIPHLIGNTDLLKGLDPREFTDDTFGVPTVVDILKELDKPGRDPRPEFKTANLREGVETISDLEVGMQLEGTVTNVTHFGAFVDIGVHQDGLVHISELANRFVKDPHDVVRAGQVVKVRVLEVDHKRRRISLSMKSDEPPMPSPRPQAKKKESGNLGAALAKAWGAK